MDLLPSCTKGVQGLAARVLLFLQEPGSDWGRPLPPGQLSNMALREQGSHRLRAGPRWPGAARSKCSKTSRMRCYCGPLALFQQLKALIIHPRVRHHPGPARPQL